jgi:DNA adenine methylase
VTAIPPRPVIRYYGGKFRIAKWIASFFPPHRVYVELFGGAASVLMQKPRVWAEVYNDLDGELVNLFRVLRDPERSARLQALLELTPYSRAEFVGSYAAVPDPVEMARRSIVRAFMGFGGSSFVSRSHSAGATGFRRFNSNDQTIPSRDWANYPQHVPALSGRLRGVLIESLDYGRLLDTYDAPETLFYADPPYLAEARSDGETRYRFDLPNASDHVVLADKLRAVVGMVALSGYPHPMYEEMYAQWERHERRAYADGGRERTEVLWLNPAAWAARRRAHPDLWDASDPAT